ncbi:dihydrolipoyl dehydrogenase family protein [Luteolibacter algae]|uniref:Dihydrolipoyl dehydrogenase family protein n=2 Tax=Luteolibacter algae TaxID=454151 RepID=A0ABW5D955_9BACT
MKRLKYQVVVIGGGSGGYAAAAKLGEYGIKTAIVEKAEKLGGLCILRGCMPSKAIIESANRMREIRSAAEFGIHVSGPTISMNEVQDRKERLIGNFQEYREDQLRNGKFDLIRGQATYRTGTVLHVKGDEELELECDYSIVATGSVPSVPEIDGLEKIDYWLSKDALDTRELPEHLIVIGGGAIGCEMAHCFEGLGSKVTIVQRSGCLLTDFDEDIGDTITEISKKRGIEVCCNSKAKSVREENGDVLLEIEQNGVTKEIRGSHLLIAAGRKPATDGLCLANANVETEKSRVKTNFHMQTSNNRIFAIGDSSSELPVVHEAVIQGEAVAKQIAIETGVIDEEISRSGISDFELFGIFTHPECARAGMRKKEIEDKSLDTQTAMYCFSDHGKSEILNETDGFVKLIVEKNSGRILSASAVGPHVIELIHEIQVAIHGGICIKDFAAIPHYHPTLAEIWTYPAEELS